MVQQTCAIFVLCDRSGWSHTYRHSGLDNTKVKLLENNPLDLTCNENIFGILSNVNGVSCRHMQLVLTLKITISII